MRRRRPARDLRVAIDCMPLPARRAMLEGIAAGRIIAGAYTDREGGVCPMLAAHRRGGRTSLASFARAWDRYTGARRRARPELNTLRIMLEASIALEEPSAHGRSLAAGSRKPANEAAPVSCAISQAGRGFARSAASTSMTVRWPSWTSAPWRTSQCALNIAGPLFEHSVKAASSRRGVS
jgi:hypothetical protein